MNRAEQEAYSRSIAWMRPFIYWATKFAFFTAGYLPEVIRFLPFQVIRVLLAHYHKKSLRSDCSPR